MKIKCRGRAEDGENIFSSSVEVDGEKVRLKDETGKWLEVEPESIVQFVGYDSTGAEIYDGDKVHGISGTMVGHTFTARVANVAQSTNGMYWGFLPEDVRKES